MSTKREQVASALRKMADMIESDHRLPVPTVVARCDVPRRCYADRLAELNAMAPSDVLRHAGAVLPRATQQSLYLDAREVATARITGIFAEDDDQPLVQWMTEAYLNDLDGVKYFATPIVTVPNFISKEADHVDADAPCGRAHPDR